MLVKASAVPAVITVSSTGIHNCNLKTLGFLIISNVYNFIEVRSENLGVILMDFNG